MLPQLITDPTGLTRLTVDGKPFPVLGGELCNSSASSLTYMEEQVWPFLKGLHLNTVLLPISWELIEPEEDCFDFSIPQGLLDQAEENGVRLIFLWFGLWKNGESHYVPQWVKEDTDRFFRAVLADGTVTQTVSPFCEAAVEADGKAFARLMTFLRDQDPGHRVIMVQVENEMGILGADRDYCQAANAAFAAPLPEEVAALTGAGDWISAFGDDAEECFMVWRYAKDIESIAARGKQILPLPMFVNAWLQQHPDIAGVYPSGGPIAKVMDLWRRWAPSLNLYCPDIYEPYFGRVCREYARFGNPLFIPEAARNVKCVSRLFYAFGAHRAIGFSPFGIEMVRQEVENPMSPELLASLNIMADAMNAANTAKYLPIAYELMEGMYSRLDGNTIGFIQEDPFHRGCVVDLDGYRIQLDFLPNETGCGGLIIPQEDGFFIAGCNTKFTVLPAKRSSSKPEILRYEEGKFVDGHWQRRRVLNGDEYWARSLGNEPSIRYLRIKR